MLLKDKKIKILALNSGMDINIVKKLGVEYDLAFYSIRGESIYINCRNIPDELPNYLKLYERKEVEVASK